MHNAHALSVPAYVFRKTARGRQLPDFCRDIAVESAADFMDYPTILRVIRISGRSGNEKLERKFQCLQRKNCTSIYAAQCWN